LIALSVAIAVSYSHGDLQQMSFFHPNLKFLFVFFIGAIVGIFSQINAGDDDESREHAVNFLKQTVLQMIPKVFDPNPDAVEALTDEIHKVCGLRYLLERHCLHIG
jgi:galactitol-specific phosphotransferase system IIC component